MPSGAQTFVSTTISTGSRPQPAKRQSGEPFRMALIGDWSGRGGRGQHDPEGLRRRPLVGVDRDDVEDMPARMGTEVIAPAGPNGEAVSVAITSIDAFDADRLAEDLPVFATLRQLGRRLANPATAEETAAEIFRRLGREDTGPDTAADTPPPPPADTGPVDLDAVLAATEQAPANPSGTGLPDLDRLIAAAVRPHAIAKPDARQRALADALDEIRAAALRGVLSADGFRAVEARWRLLDLICRRVETGPELRLDLLDCTAAELTTDLASAATGDPTVTALGRVLGDAAEETPWAALIVADDFGLSEADQQGLTGLARLAAALGTSAIAGATPDIVGSAGFRTQPDPDDWAPADGPARAALDALRAGPAARHLALVAPRVLARGPYGTGSRSIDAFDFDELPEGTDPATVLPWASGALIAGLTLAEAFMHDGWSTVPGLDREIPDMPFATIQVHGEAEQVSAAEAFLGQRAVQTCRAAGITPLLGIRGTDGLRLSGLRSVAADAASLAGVWAG